MKERNGSTESKTNQLNSTKLTSLSPSLSLQQKIIMPVHTRSTTKKQLGKGYRAFISISDTGEGIHTRFEYPRPSDYLSSSASGTDDFNYESNDRDGFHRSGLSSLSSLSSISSGSSEGSFNSSMISPNTPVPSMWDTYHNIVPFATTTASNKSPSRPVKRNRAQRWVRDPESGELRMMPEGSSEEDQTFQREYQSFLEKHCPMADLTRRNGSNRIAMQELDDEDMAYYDSQEMSFTSATNSATTSGSSNNNNNDRPLVAADTEYIDETYRPPPGELGVYPQQWIAFPSNLLQSQPTESFM